MSTETIDWKAIEARNKLINEFMEREPKVSYGVATDDAICYDASHFTDHPASQKQDCDRWLKEQHDRFPRGWVATGGYTTRKFEYFPNYHSDWNELIPACKKCLQITQDQERPNVNACNNADWLECQIGTHMREYNMPEVHNSLVVFIEAYNKLK